MAAGSISSVTVSDISSTSYKLTWTAAAGGADATTGYNLFHPNSGNYFTSVSSATLTYTFTGLTAATAYGWGVEATSANGGGPRSTGSTTTAAAATPPPSVTAEAPALSVWNDPIPLTIVNGSGYTSLSWAVTSAPSGSTAAVVGTSPASLTPDKIGTYKATVTATGAGGTASSTVTTVVRAQLWRKTAGGIVPVKIVRRTS